jgi:hypothetical protein
VADCFEHGDEPSAPIKSRFIDKLSERLFKKDSAP